MNIYYIDTEGWVTEEWVLNEFINTTEHRDEYELFKKAIVTKEERCDSE